VVDGEVQGVLERVPGGVVGNGRDSVRVLLEQQNHDRRTALDDRRYLYAMDFDDEAVKLLAAQGLTGDSVPAAGQAVRLRSASNVASGGVPVELTLDQVHGDNLRLAVRAARVLRLDVAGIDLLAPDIGRSWLETGANICEVNAMPQMFTTMHKPMLRSLFKGGNGRIPVVLVIDAARPELAGGRADPSTAAAPWPGRRAGPRQRDVGGCAYGGRPVWPAAWWVRACWCWTRRCRPWSWP
jgi:cyanophycin synthetase